MTASSSSPPPLAAPDPAQWEAGRQIDGFVLQARLHEGNASHLWQVTDPRQATALPLLLKVASRTPEAMVRLEVEQAVLALLGGPHVPRLHGQGEADGLPYLVMERIEGPSLHHRLQDTPRLPWAEVVDLAQRLAGALHQVHRQGALHLDLQPRHIMFRASGELVLVGWGLARHEQQPDLHESTLDLDNGAYLSPEQIHWQRHDLRSDLFSWAVVVYEALTGQRPFGTPDSARALRRRLALQAPPPRALRPECAEWLQEFLLRNLELEAAQRHATAAQLAFNLRHPDPLALTERALRTEASPARPRALWQRWRESWLPWSADLEQPHANPLPTIPLNLQLHHHPLVMVVVDLQAPAASQAALRHQLAWTLRGTPHAHLACTALVLLPEDVDVLAPADSDGAAAPSPSMPSVTPLAHLRHWAHPLVHPRPHPLARPHITQALAGLSFHVIECTGGRTVDAVSDWAAWHLVDQVVMGASPSARQATWNLGCTLTLVPSSTSAP